LLFEPKFEIKDKKVEFNAKLSTAKDFTGSINVKDIITEGTKLELSGTQNEKEGLTTKAVTSFKNKTFSTQLAVTYPIPEKKGKQPIKVIGELVLNYPENVYLATNVAVDVGDKPKTKGEGVVAYYTKDWQVTARAAHEIQTEKSSWGVSFFHKLSSLVKFTVDFDVDSSASDPRGPIAQVGGEYKYNSDTTLKSKVIVKQDSEPEYRLALSGKQKISNHFTATFGSDFNLRQLLGTNVGESHSFGLELNLQE